jgi:hypothetical protein
MAEACWHRGRVLSALLVRGTLDSHRHGAPCMVPNLQVTKVHIHRPCGTSSSPLLAVATSLMAGANSLYERASSALLARSYVNSAHDCWSENPHPDAPPMRTSGLACDPSTPHMNEGPDLPTAAGSVCKIRFDPICRCVALRWRMRRVGFGRIRSRFDGRPQ